MTEWLTIPAAARRLGVAEITVRRRLKTGELVSRKERGRHLILVPDEPGTEITEGRDDFLRQEYEDLKARHQEAQRQLILLANRNGWLEAQLARKRPWWRWWR